MGLRFLFPVLFVDDVELTKHSCNTIDLIHSTTLMLKSMMLNPALRDSLSGRFIAIGLWRKLHEHFAKRSRTNAAESHQTGCPL